MSAATTTKNPLEAAHAALIKKLSALVPPKAIRIFPGPSDFEAVADYIRQAADICDEWIEAIGFQVADNSSHAVDARSFEDAVSAGLDSAIYECSCEAETLIEGRRAA